MGGSTLISSLRSPAGEEPNLGHKTISFGLKELEGRDGYRLMASLVTPRPIAWVSTVGKNGTVNLAPFSFYNAVSGRPPTLLISFSPREGVEKDTLRNCRETGEFVVNVVDASLAERMNETARECPYGVNEFELAGLTQAPSVEVRPPRVAEAMAAMEARVSQIIPVQGSTSVMVLGRVVHFHLREGLLTPEWTADTERLNPLGRLGRDYYTTLGRVFRMPQPD